MKKTVFVSALCFLFVLAPAGNIFTDQTEQDKLPVFRSEVIFVEVDAVVTYERAGQARIYALVLDDLHTAAERTGRTRELARRFIEQWIQPEDFVSVTSTSGALQLVCNLEAHRASRAPAGPRPLHGW
jgi:hypothetical protein